jgi:hypothetical protein
MQFAKIIYSCTQKQLEEKDDMKKNSTSGVMTGFAINSRNIIFSKSPQKRYSWTVKRLSWLKEQLKTKNKEEISSMICRPLIVIEKGHKKLQREEKKSKSSTACSDLND